MSDEITNTINKLHSCQLLLAAELKRICEENNIKYFIIAGTLLGAVRHKGFIPWDDDMDFAIMRKDYARFIKVCEEQLGDDFILQNISNDPYYGLPLSKLLLKGTNFTERNASKNKSKKGIFIDIFPFDSIPDDENLRKKHNRNTYILKRLLLAKQDYTIAEKGQLAKQIIYGALKFVSFFFSKNFLIKKLEKELCRFENQNTKKVAAIGGAYQYNKESVLREWFEKTVELPFENLTLSAPEKYVEYLTYFYGDYMTPPPENKRANRHSAVEIDFGEYKL